MYSPSRVVICFCIALWADVAVAGQSLPSAVPCKRNPVLFMFGDSNSDTGGYVSANGKLDSYPNGRAFPKLSGRVGDGRLIIDFLCENLTASYLSSYLNSMEPNFKNGVNYAFSGANAKNFSFNLEIQINQMIRFHNLSLELNSKGFKDLHVQEDFQNALYIIDIGQNDLVVALAKHPLSEVLGSSIPQSIDAIRKAIMAIYGIGGRNFWIHNTGPLGCLPLELAFHKVNTSAYDEHGCIRTSNEAARAFNSQLDALCQQTRAQLKDATVVLVDIYSIKYNLYAYHDVYGFINPQKACCETCLNIGSYICEEGSKYISWDGVHYTESANSLVAAKILTKNFSKPPLPFSFFCNN